MVLKTFNTSCLDITAEATPDPHVTQADGKFYLTFTANNRIPMWDARSLMAFHDRPKRGAVFWSRWATNYSERLWAPELHRLRGRWYIYFAGANAAVGNRSHRMFVLGGPRADKDPHAGPWRMLGPIKGMDQAQWAIDGTVIDIDGTLYMVYSGWPWRGADGCWEDSREQTQQLFIIRLKDPVTADAAAAPVCISKPTEAWEQTGDVAINEGPQWLCHPDGKSWRGLGFSCSASWTKHYKMATLQYVEGQDPMSPDAWKKSAKPLLQNREDGKGPYGPGHGCFLDAGGETVALFHATDKDTDGNRNRRCRMQRVRWTSEGPDMGGYVGVNTKDLDVFMDGERTTSNVEADREHELRGLLHALTRR